MLLGGTLHTGGKKSSISFSYKPCDLQQRSACKIYWFNNGTNVMEVTNHFFKKNVFKAHSMRCNIHDTDKVVKDLRLDRPWVLGKPSTIILLKEQNNNVISDDIVLQHHSTHIREISYSRWELTKKSTMINVQRMRLWSTRL